MQNGRRKAPARDHRQVVEDRLLRRSDDPIHQRRRASRDLDRLLGVGVASAVQIEPTDRGDYWRATGMDTTIQQREYRGRELLAAGWVA